MKKIIRPQKGQILVLSAVLLPILLAVFALTIEVGNAYVHQSRLQNAADAAALAGAKSSDETIARQFIEANLTTSEINNLTTNDVTVNDNNCNVKLVENVSPLYFSFIGEFTLTAEAVANNNQLVAYNE